MTIRNILKYFVEFFFRDMKFCQRYAARCHNIGNTTKVTTLIKNTCLLVNQMR